MIVTVRMPFLYLLPRVGLLCCDYMLRLFFCFVFFPSLFSVFVFVSLLGLRALHLSFAVRVRVAAPL